MIVLHREFWADECVIDLVSFSCVFWQKLDASPEGKLFIERYKVRGRNELMSMTDCTIGLHLPFRECGRIFLELRLPVTLNIIIIAIRVVLFFSLLRWLCILGWEFSTLARAV